MKTRKIAVLVATLIAALATASGAAYAGGSDKTTFTMDTGGPVPQIIGGRPATEAYPFMASLQHQPNPDRPNPHQCGATLISPTWLVTAAHCVARLDGTLLDPSNYLVKIGSTDNQAGATYQIERFVAHPYWGAGKENHGDIGLIKLERAAPQPFIATVSRATPPGTSVRLLGWGRTVEDDPNSLPRQLRELNSTLRPYDDCIHGDPYDITPGDLCVDDHGRTATICNGDSGGPLLVKVRGSWQLAGVASRIPGETGCLTGPSVYTSTNYYWHWVQVIMLNNNHRAPAAAMSR